jgi:hypothetical protein
MGKIILEFDSIEESQDARVALDAMKWKMAMWDLDQKLRGTTKYGASQLDKSKEANDEEMNIAEKYRDMIREILNNYNLNIED